jgi:hypothetical protein
VGIPEEFHWLSFGADFGTVPAACGLVTHLKRVY